MNLNNNTRLIIAITGVPTTGKTTFAKKIIKKLHITSVEINDLAKLYNTYTGTDSLGTKIVDIKKLNKAINNYIKINNQNIILVGHLAADLNIKYDIAIVMRKPLKVIAKRMERRNYQIEKINENIIAEAYDYCSKIKRFSKETYEIETKGEANQIIKYLTCIIKQQKKDKKICKKPKIKEKYYFLELLNLIKKGNKYNL
ncbi:MAG: AAA family ATPase [Candidatus Marsarchaeota archaeon]|nr:AAA family ATPase [Candidatus Marsarchaeota archaeon]